VASYGDSYDHAVSNLREAVELYLENAKALDLLEDIEERLTTKEKFTTRIEAAVP
jgi:predicted RNase H-like HicB family nuclease